MEGKGGRMRKSRPPHSIIMQTERTTGSGLRTDGYLWREAWTVRVGPLGRALRLLEEIGYSTIYGRKGKKAEEDMSTSDVMDGLTRKWMQTGQLNTGRLTVYQYIAI